MHIARGKSLATWATYRASMASRSSARRWRWPTASLQSFVWTRSPIQMSTSRRFAHNSLRTSGTAETRVLPGTDDNIFLRTRGTASEHLVTRIELLPTQRDAHVELCSLYAV